MPEKSKAQRKETTFEKQKPMQEMADKAMRNYEQTVRTGQKLQEEATRWWSSMLGQAVAPDWQKPFANFTAMANNMMPMAQKRMQDFVSLMEKSSRTTAELMRKAVDAAQTPGIAESQAKWMEFWTSSMGAARSNAEAFTEMSTRAIDSWIDFIRKNTEVTEVRVPKAA